MLKRHDRGASSLVWHETSMVQQRCIDKECFIVEKLGPSIIYGFDPWPPSTILSVLPNFVIFFGIEEGSKILS